MTSETGSLILILFSVFMVGIITENLIIDYENYKKEKVDEKRKKN